MTQDPRRAGAVTRYHTWPRIRQQSIAEHSWNIARIMRAIWPEVPITVIYHCLFHDLGEVGTGDLPYPAKKLNPKLKTAANKLEHDTYLEMVIPWGLPAPVELTVEAQAIFKLCEWIEVAEWSADEKHMGNSFAHKVAERANESIHQLLREVPEGIAAEAQRYMKMRNKTYE